MLTNNVQETDPVLLGLTTNKMINVAKSVLSVLGNELLKLELLLLKTGRHQHQVTRYVIHRHQLYHLYIDQNIMMRHCIIVPIFYVIGVAKHYSIIIQHMRQLYII